MLERYHNNPMKAAFVIALSTLLIACIALLVMLPIQLESNRYPAEGELQAEHDWARREAVRFAADAFPSVILEGWEITYYYDVKTGLRISPAARTPGGTEYSIAYNSRIDELMETHGIPEWSRSKLMPSPMKMVQSIQSTGMRPVELPFRQSDDLHLARGTNASSGSLEIRTRHGLVVGDQGSVFIEEHEGGVTFVRVADRQLFAFGPLGELLATLTRK